MMNKSDLAMSMADGLGHNDLSLDGTQPRFLTDTMNSIRTRRAPSKLMERKRDKWSFVQRDEPGYGVFENKRTGKRQVKGISKKSRLSVNAQYHFFGVRL
jgi:hypothetical protein